MNYKEIIDIEALKAEVSDEKSSHGIGGMTSKVFAVQITQKANIEIWIVNGLKKEYLDFTTLKNNIFVFFVN